MGSRFTGGRGGSLAAATNASAKTNAAASGAEDSEDEDDFVDASDMMDDDDDFLSPESKVLKSHQTHIFCHLASRVDATPLSKKLKQIIQKLNILPTKTNDFIRKLLNLLDFAQKICPHLSFSTKPSLNSEKIIGF